MSFFDEMGSAYTRLTTPDPTAEMTPPNIQQAIDDGFIDEPPLATGPRTEYLNRETPQEAKPYRHEYKVASGDTLSKIALDNNTTVEAIADLNELEDVNNIKVGQALNLGLGDTELPLETTEPDLVDEETEEEEGGLFSSQAAKNLLSSFNPFQGDKTEEDYSPDVLDSLRRAATNAMSRGKMNIDYEDYGTGEDGDKTRQAVSNTESRKKTKGGIGKMADKSHRDAALSIGGGTLVEEDGDIYLTDTYDFSRVKRPDSNSDAYYALRYAMGELSNLGVINKYKSRVLLGSKEDLVDKSVVTVESGDTLSKLANNHNTSVEALMSLNNISDKNKIKIGDRLSVV